MTSKGEKEEPGTDERISRLERTVEKLERELALLKQREAARDLSPHRTVDIKTRVDNLLRELRQKHG